MSTGLGIRPAKHLQNTLPDSELAAANPQNNPASVYISNPQSVDAASIQAAKSLQTALIDNVNHEIRTPLAGIMATAQILHDEVGPNHQELTEMLVESGKRMNNAISNVIELVALKEDVYQLDTVPVQVSEEVELMVSSHQKQATTKGIKLDIGPINKKLTLQTDPQLLRKVLNHLLNNAIKFTDSGSVKLSVKEDKRWLHVEIKDTGVGISKAFLPNIYQPFTQGSQGLCRTHNGQGLGLALTKRMVDLAGGKISVATESGAGCTVTVSYPSAK
ncbi:MAG: sensor histidine kinase [Rhodothermales bacterium]